MVIGERRGATEVPQGALQSFVASHIISKRQVIKVLYHQEGGGKSWWSRLVSYTHAVLTSVCRMQGERRRVTPLCRTLYEYTFSQPALPLVVVTEYCR